MHYYPIGVIGVTWVFWIWETYLDYRQYRVYQTTKELPKELEGKIDIDTFVKAKSYSIDKARFGFISGLFGQTLSSFKIYYFLMPFFWNLSGSIMTDSLGFTKSTSIEWEIFQSILFTFVTSLLSTVVTLPFSIYNTFVIEQRHGFNKQTPAFFAWDKIKMLLVSFLIASPIMAATIYIVRNTGPYFPLYLWMFCFVVVCLLTFFHGEIAAIFDKFTPLPPGKLRERIEELAKSVNFPLTNIFVVEGSKRSSHSNAYQSGTFNKKRIVIYDTLIEGYYDDKKDDTKEDDKEKQQTSDSQNKEDKSATKRKGCNHDEIIAVLCHELGHWYHGHLIKHLTFAEINYFFMFVIFAKVYQNPEFYAAFGFDQEMPIIIGLTLLMMLLTPYNEILGFIATSMSRHFEYQSDEYAMKKGKADDLKIALIKLNIDNLGFPVHDELYSKFNHSHPTLIQRIKALEKSD